MLTLMDAVDHARAMGRPLFAYACACLVLVVALAAVMSAWDGWRDRCDARRPRTF